ncbi:MAG: hypothetical protein ABJ308_07245 [Halieaceae bacterium]
MPACNDAYLQTLDQRSVKQFLDELDSKRKNCFYLLGKKTKG